MGARGLLMPRLTPNPASMADMAASELATMADSEDSTAARGPLMRRLTLNPASMADTEAMAVMAASAGATLVASEDSTVARGPLMPRLTLNPASLVDTEAMAAIEVATMVDSEDATSDKFMRVFKPRPSQIVTLLFKIGFSK